MTTATAQAPRWLVALLVALVALPMLVALVAQRDGTWYPVFDLAMTELRVRDVGGPHTPLIGLQGRIGPNGSHPGPLSFYLLAPVYRLLGSSSFALQAATVAFHVAAVAAALAVVRRRRSTWAVVGLGIVLLLLVLGYGLGTFLEPWNPHLPVLWFVVFLVSAWGVLDDDLAMLVPAVVAGSLCAQTHVPYLALTLLVGSGVTVLAAAEGWSRRRNGETVGLGWAAAALVVGLVLWTPPLIDEAINEPGNLSQIVDNLGTPEEEPIGLRRSGTFVLERLDVWQLVVVEPQHPGTYTRVLTGPGPESSRGAVALVTWLACVGAAAVLRHRRLLALHAVVGGATLAAWLAISRIHGQPWPYLMQWGFGIGALMLLAIGATLVVALGRALPATRRPWLQQAITGTGLVVATGLALRLIAIAPDASPDTPELTARLGRIVAPTAEALEAGRGAATGSDGRYRVTWFDATHGGAEGIGMVNELVRRGFDVGVAERDRVRIGPHRVRDEDDATAEVVVASGGWIERVASEPGAVRVAYDDPRTAAEREEFAEARAAAAAALVDSGRPELVELLDTDLFGVGLNSGIDVEVGLVVGRMLDIGVPMAVFVLPGAGS